MQQQKQQMNSVMPISLIIVAILTSLTVLGGMPSGERVGIFWFGVVATIGTALAIGGVGWYLLFRPLPDAYKLTHRPLITGRMRHIVGLFMVLGLVNIGMGSAWDEIWHSKYGLPFGEDFFWRPHQMIYFGFIVTILVAAYSLYVMMTRARGTFQQRFRTDLVLGVAILSGAYLSFALPADPLWHNLYGEDIAAWSLPHIVLVTLILVMGIAAVALQRSLDSKREWKILMQFNLRDMLVALIFSAVMHSFLVVFSSEWYVIAQAQTPESNALLESRPDWLFVALMTLASSLVGGLAIHATKRVGMALTTGIIALLLRLSVEWFIQTPYTGLLVFGVVFPVLIGIEIAYFYNVRQGKPPSWWMASLASGALIGVIGLLVIDRYFLYRKVTPISSLTMIIATIITTAIGLKLAGMITEFFRHVEGLEGATESKDDIPQWLDGVVYAGFGLLAFFLMFTAIPPA